MPSWNPAEFELPEKGTRSAEQMLSGLLTSINTSREEECYRDYQEWMVATPVEDTLRLIPAIQARRDIGILDPDEALFLIGRAVEAVMESMYETHPLLLAYEDSIDELRDRLARDHEISHGCTLENGECFHDDAYFCVEDALEDSGEYAEINRQADAACLRIELEMLREHGEDEIARLREHDQLLFEERCLRGLDSLFPPKILLGGAMVRITEEDLDELSEDADPDTVAAFLRRLIAERRLDQASDERVE